MIKSNRAAALRWLDGNIGATLDTVQTDAAGAIRWIPGPRRLVKIGATRYGMIPADAAPGSGARPSYLTTDGANRFHVAGDTLTIEALTGLTSGPSGVAEVWHITHYSVRTAEAFTVAHELTVARVND